MMDQHSDSGYELVLDNRRLVIAFAVLIVFFGGFFVIGFMEGKRQGFQAGSQMAAETGANTIPDELLVKEPQAAGTDSARTADEQPEEKSLEWYKNVSERESAKRSETTGAPARKEIVKTETAKPTAATIVKSSAPAVSSTPGTYSVQVGAFRQKQQADAKAGQLRAKGFDSRVEPPTSDDGLYLLKVGRFKSRAEAVAMQLRLKKSGFSSFIKTN